MFLKRSGIFGISLLADIVNLKFACLIGGAKWHYNVASILNFLITPLGSLFIGSIKWIIILFILYII